MKFAVILENISYNPKKNSYRTRRRYIEDNLKNRVDKLLNPYLAKPKIEIEEESSEIEDGPNVLENERKKNILPSNVIDIWTRFEVLLGLKLNEPTDILTEASNKVDEISRKPEVEIEHQYLNALHKITSSKEI